MVKISIPINEHTQEGKQQYFTFAVHAQAVMLAGSRNLELPPTLCDNLVAKLYALRFHFFVGCAQGVDQSFRKALARTPANKNAFVACAFYERMKHENTCGLYASVVVPDKIPPAAALARRTIWMARRCQFLILFPDNPITGKWGKGSMLAFNSAVLNLKPVFVVSKTAPPSAPLYNIFPTSLFDVVDGCWVVPHPYENNGLCYGELIIM
jgi:hypothetical protein